MIDALKYRILFRHEVKCPSTAKPSLQLHTVTVFLGRGRLFCSFDACPLLSPLSRRSTLCYFQLNSRSKNAASKFFARDRRSFCFMLGRNRATGQDKPVDLQLEKNWQVFGYWSTSNTSVREGSAINVTTFRRTRQTQTWTFLHRSLDWILQLYVQRTQATFCVQRSREKSASCCPWKFLHTGNGLAPPAFNWIQMAQENLPALKGLQWSGQEGSEVVRTLVRRRPRRTYLSTSMCFCVYNNSCIYYEDQHHKQATRRGSKIPATTYHWSQTFLRLLCSFLVKSTILKSVQDSKT